MSGGDGTRGGSGVGARRRGLTAARPVLPGQVEAPQHLQQLSWGLAGWCRGVPGVLRLGAWGVRRGRGRRDLPVPPLRAAPAPCPAPLLAVGARPRAVPPREAVGDPPGALHSLRGGGGFSSARLLPAPPHGPAFPTRRPPAHPALLSRPRRAAPPGRPPPPSPRGQRAGRFAFGFGSAVFLFALQAAVSLVLFRPVAVFSACSFLISLSSQDAAALFGPIAFIHALLPGGAPGAARARAGLYSTK